MTTQATPALLSAETAAQLAETFAVLSDPSRVRLLHALDQAEHTTGALATALGLSDSAVSHQLRTLRALRLVVSRREGRRIWHTLADDHVRQLIRQGLDHATEAPRAAVTHAGTPR